MRGGGDIPAPVWSASGTKMDFLELVETKVHATLTAKSYLHSLSFMTLDNMVSTDSIIFPSDI